ncbi:hypothetical protein Nepgr_023307 [Nepenthes gracilis]|uniref:Lon proteolytic domain-containing protein n=1 Tax=Nepenthes gracilis TaxID=150966 RepID=A0AAD3XYZ6_NEPGR|nr:hypothetical protein Nepgr_023307 [Nepenthes gracilis]
MEALCNLIHVAHQYGIRRVILPEENSKNLVEVPLAFLDSLEIILVKQMEEILQEALHGGCPWRQYQNF